MKRLSVALPWILLVALIAIGAGTIPDHIRDSNGFDHPVLGFAIKATDSGDNTLVAGQTGYLIKLLSIGVRSYGDTPVNWYIKTDTDGGIWGDSGTPFTADQTMLTGPAGESWPFSPVGEIATATAGEDLEINLSAATPLWVRGSYIMVPE